ncbi:hypothetical protein Poli38472_010381 [Pythium oligandrum]|uniref:Uncharacterized protein n=1 Tax=Pythium oligandrum TaxID=41045 RepID=A0A8K1FC56_PYTOL|nr:hypothetical protein Poli38472_010381 [Pythium oligandrum]|eukprot:TMW55499.1 hypothetical protein Poli38472_010381 [Pythium oligandrum]
MINMGTPAPRRIKLYCQDEDLRRRHEENARQLLATAQSPSCETDTSAILAKKALRYRKVLDRMDGVDVTSPQFDASKFLGVHWCKRDEDNACVNEDEAETEQSTEVDMDQDFKVL